MIAATRRGFIGCFAALIGAPAVVRADTIMRVVRVPPLLRPGYQAAAGEIVTRENGEYICTLAEDVPNYGMVSVSHFNKFARDAQDAGDRVARAWIHPDLGLHIQGRGWSRLDLNGSKRPTRALTEREANALLLAGFRAPS
jgi:hypothetical protein